MQPHSTQDQGLRFPFLGGGATSDPDVLLSNELRLFALVTASSDAIYRMSGDWSQMHQLQLRL
jgi:hypothetical protein